MHNRRAIAFVIQSCLFFCAASVQAQQSSTSAPTMPKTKEEVLLPAQGLRVPVEVIGRLTLEEGSENNSPQEWLVLHGKDARTYIVKGDLRERLKKTCLELGEKNLVSLKGIWTGEEIIVCKNDFRPNMTGSQDISTRCIRYLGMEPDQIIFAQVSEETMPPPERDATQEAFAKSNAVPSTMGAPNQIIEITGKILSVNFIGAIKTMEIAFKDKFGKDLQKNIIINPSAKIARRKPGVDTPVYVAANALKAGQEITVVYLRRETSNEAIAITIIKE